VRDRIEASDYVDRVGDDLVDGRVLVDDAVDERTVGAVFKKPVNQVGEQILVRTDRRIDPEKLDATLLVFVKVLLDRTDENVFDEFKRAILNMPQVLECQMVAGGFDYLIKARVKDLADYRRFLGQSLVILPSVRETLTYVVMEEVKSTTAIPVAL
jgi:DNA-binding Lrp family transcriptional regulator